MLTILVKKGTIVLSISNRGREFNNSSTKNNRQNQYNFVLSQIIDDYNDSIYLSPSNISQSKYILQPPRLKPTAITPSKYNERNTKQISKVTALHTNDTIPKPTKINRDIIRNNNQKDVSTEYAAFQEQWNVRDKIKSFERKSMQIH